MAQAGAPGCSLFLLGGFELRLDGETTLDASWPRRKSKALLKLLALQPGRSAHREMVIETLWPGADLRAGANNLNQSLHLLRRALGDIDVVRVREGSVALTPEAWVDVEAFREAMARAAATRDVLAYEEALGLYRGDLLPEDCYEDWTSHAREDLAALRGRALLDVAELHAQRGDVGRAEGRLRELLGIDPLEEEPQRRLMRLLSDSGSPRRAMAQYRGLRARLEAELGVEPSDETDALADEIRARIATGRDDPPREPLDVRFAKSADGTSIAYATYGSGDPPLLHLPTLPWCDLQVQWEIPQWRAWVERLARGRATATYDCRGSGLSQRHLEDVSVERQTEDMEAVVDALGWTRFDVFACENVGPAIVGYIDRHPERVRRIVFHHSWADGPRYAAVMGRAGFRQMMQHDWETYRDAMTRMVTGYDEDLGPRVANLLERSCSRDMVDRLWEAVTAVDVTPLLSSVLMPAMMIRRREAASPAWPLSLEMVAALSRGELREVDGSEFLMIAGDIEPLACAIEEFLDSDEP